MGKKTLCLKRLQEAGINVHEYEEVRSFEELIRYIELNPNMSIRFDDDQGTTDLPFYVIDNGDQEHLREIVEQAKIGNFTMLVSNGHQYDADQICNFVGKVSPDGTFELEYSIKKIPLRHMYRRGTTSVRGNYGDLSTYSYLNRNDNIISKQELEDILTYLFQIKIYNRDIEGTLYPYPVGVYKRNIVIWQVREEDNYGRKNFIR